MLADRNGNYQIIESLFFFISPNDFVFIFLAKTAQAFKETI